MTREFSACKKWQSARLPSLFERENFQITVHTHDSATGAKSTAPSAASSRRGLFKTQSGKNKWLFICGRDAFLSPPPEFGKLFFLRAGNSGGVGGNCEINSNDSFGRELSRRKG